MADQVYLSCWFRGSTEHNLLGMFEKVLQVFPYSKLRPLALARVYAVEFSEPTTMERTFEGEIDTAAIIGALREFENPDCAFQVETHWDLWQLEDSWRIAPAPITLTCFGPLFPSELGESLRIDLGFESSFLPGPSPNFTAIRSNIRSLLHLAEDIRKAVPLEKKTLWSESGVNLAERLELALVT